MWRRPGQHLAHGPRRLMTRPWRRVCRCGFGGWPCYPQQMLRRQAMTLAKGRAPVYPARRPTLGVNGVAPLLTRGQVARSRQGGRW